jgi:hypothetical protein
MVIEKGFERPSVGAVLIVILGIRASLVPRENVSYVDMGKSRCTGTYSLAASSSKSRTGLLVVGEGHNDLAHDIAEGKLLAAHPPR